MSDQLQLRRDTLANIQAAVPAQGEAAFATDTGQLFIGDGATPGGVFMAPSFAFPGYIGGRFYPAGSTNGGTFTLVANTLYAIPFIALAKVAFTKLSVNVTTGVAATNARIGIYTNATGVIAPGALIAGSDSGSFSTATAGLKESTGLSIALNPGFYWFAVMSGGAPTLTGCNGNTLAPFLYGMSSLGISANELGYSASQSFGAMPSSFPAGTVTLGANALPLIGARL